MDSDTINRGYVILARAMEDSQLWQLGPDCLRVAIWLLMRARFDREPKKFPGFEVGRGEVLTSLAQVAEECAWIENRREVRFCRSKVKRVFDKLTSIGFMVDLRNSSGTHVKLCNYGRYQCPENYLRNSSETTAEQLRNSSETTAELYNNGKKGKKVKNDEEPLLVDFGAAVNGDTTTGNQDQENERRQPAREREAERIYAAYPKKVGKAAAVKSIEKALKSGVPSEQLLVATEQFARAVQGADMQYVPNPATWYNQARWEDDPALWATIGRDRATGQNAARGPHSGLQATQVFYGSEDIRFPEEKQ